VRCQRPLRLVVLLLVPLCAASAPPAAPADTVVEARIERITNGLLPAVKVTNRAPMTMTLRSRMTQLNVPGVSIAVIHAGTIEWARGFGVTRLDGPPVTPDTLFQAGSISKPVASMGALKLVEQGKLRLDEDVNRVLVSWKLPENDFTKKKQVTLRGLMTHSAGLTVHGFPGYAAGEPVPTVPQVLDGAKPLVNTDPVRVDMEPGTKWRYSGGGITILQLMMTDVTRKRFPELMQELVLGPLGMTHSTYEEPLPACATGASSDSVLSAAARCSGRAAHVSGDGGRRPLDHRERPGALGDRRAGGPRGKSNRVLSQSTLEQMTRRQFENWGLGVAVGGEGEKANFGHGGVDEGFDAQLFAYAKTGDGVAIMTNANGGQTLATEILRAVAKEYGWPDYKQQERTAIEVDAATLATYAGSYELPNRRLSVSVREGRLYVSLGGGEIEALAATPTKFFGVFQGNWYEFQPGDDGQMTVTVTAGTNVVKGKRAP
jgi:CubicO group peptidase (beta-lactamase class C family)